MNDPFNLERFVEAQNEVIEEVFAELREGHKRTHWMWFVFPQISGLGHSPMAERFAISGLPEAVAYLEHPILGQRLRECTNLVNAIQGRTISKIFGYPDDLKFHSCMTLFARAAPDNREFTEALHKYFGGEPDPITIKRLQIH